MASLALLAGDPGFEPGLTDPEVEARKTGK